MLTYADVCQALVGMFPELHTVQMLDFRVRTLRGATCSNAYGAAESPSATQEADRDCRKMWTEDVGGGGRSGVGGVGAGGGCSAGGEEAGSGSAVRVMVECQDGCGTRWRTMAVSSSVLDAFVLAYCDAIVWRLLSHRSN